MAFIKPLIGVEYVIKLNDSNFKQPLFICTLCDKRCDPRTIEVHMTSQRHRLKYLDVHFPALMRILNRDRKFNFDMSHREEVLTKVVQQLQDKFGVGKPSIFEYREYERNKDQITEKVKNLKHFNEKDFPGSEKILLEGIKIENDGPLTSYVKLSSVFTSILGEQLYGKLSIKMTQSSKNTSNKKHKPSEKAHNALDIISALGFLSALEDELGSIAFGVIKLLEEAVAMERNEANSSEKLLQVAKNVNFLSTCKEKLKGLLSADVVVNAKRKRAVVRAIDIIESVLQ